MKKLYSTIMMLAMMVAAMSLTACGGDDDEEDTSDDVVLVKYNGSTIDYDNFGEDLGPRYEARDVDGAQFIIFCPFDFAIFQIVFPRSDYGDLSSSYFKKGYSGFGSNDTDIQFTDASSSVWYGDNVGGSATVVDNNGKYISVKFNNYKGTAKGGDGSTKELTIIKGIIKFKIQGDYR